jgi:16S rRNA (guanine527-N7)-methyltransferase
MSASPLALDPDALHGVTEALERSRDLGFLGPGPVTRHIDHAVAMATVIIAEIGGTETRRGLDLGTGGGVPGLVLAALLPGWEWTLLDSMVRRTAVVQQLVDSSPLFRTCVVVTRRAEEWAAAHRGELDLVVSRSFGPPAMVAECSAPMLGEDGCLVVSEPPETNDRWNGVDRCGLGFGPMQMRTVAGSSFAVLRRSGSIAQRLPRKPSAMRDRPLF